ncbi:hypothetical protein GEMRC1_010056 [Eukaryota sp. GEM-RC1]
MLNEVEDDELIDLLPSFAEETRITLLMHHMKELQFVSLQLQKENSNSLDAEHLFKSTMLVFCQYNANQEMKKQLVYPAVDAPRCPPNQFIFKSAVLKILKNEGLSLTDEEEVMVKCFKEHEIEIVAGQSRLSSSLDGKVIINNDSKVQRYPFLTKSVYSTRDTGVIEQLIHDTFFTSYATTQSSTFYLDDVLIKSKTRVTVPSVRT